MTLCTDANRLTINRPDLMERWDFNKNTLDPNKLTICTNEKVWWICEKEGHSYYASVSSQNYGKRCIYCFGQSVLPGFNDIDTLYPHIASMWSNKNEKTSSCFRPGSHKKAWFVCPNDVNGEFHEFFSSIKSVCILGTRCPYCANQKILTGYNDLAHLYPEVIEYWDYESNLDLDPRKIGINSTKKARFVCSLNHKWTSVIRNLTVGGTRCPFCSGKRVLPGFNDVCTSLPKCLEYWDYNKNTVKPTEISIGSDKKIWWKCNSNHSFGATILNFRNRNFVCLICLKGASTGERGLLSFIEGIIPDNILIYHNTRTIIKPYELDIYIPELKLAFEFNGMFWHSNRGIRRRTKGKFKTSKYHKMKSKICKSKGIKLIHIPEYLWVNEKERTCAYLSKQVKDRIVEVYK